MAVPPAQPADDDQKTPPARPHRARRWLVRILIFVVGVVLLVGIVVQLVLATSLPKSIVVGQVEKGFGLRMGATDVSTGWFGRTTLKGVKLALPLSDQSFVDVPEMRVRHTGLIAMMLGRPLLIKEVALEKPIVYVRQDAAGRWNLEEVAELLARTAGKKTGEETAQNSDAPALPRIQVNALTAVVHDNRNRELKIEPVNVTGFPETPVSWSYDIEIPSNQENVPPHFSLKGRVAPGGTWAHQAHVWVHDIDPWVAVYKAGFNAPLSLDASWRGELNPKGLTGYLQISDATYADYHAGGALDASRTDEGVFIRPHNLSLKTPVPQLSEVRVPRGEIAYDGKVVRLTRLQAGLLGGPAELNGWFDPVLNQGALEAYWQDVALANAKVRQSGKLNVTYHNPPAANMNVDVLLSSSGTAPDGPFEALAKVNVNGRDFADFAWRVETPQLSWHRPQPLILDGLAATGTYRQDPQHKVVRLQTVSLPTDNRLAGTGSYDLATKEGRISLSGQDWPVHLIEGTRLAFDVEATGRGVPSTTEPGKTKPLIELTHFFLRSGDASLTASGAFDGREPKPVSGQVVFENQPGAAATMGEPVLIDGRIRAQAKLTGTLAPLNIGIEGSLAGRNAVVLNHFVGDLRTAVHGTIDYDKAQVRADAIPFLDGLWTLGAVYETHKDDKPVYATTVDMSVEHLPLRKVAAFLDVPPIEGRFDGRWFLYYPKLKPDPNKMILTGGGTIDQLDAAPGVAADRVSFQTTLKDGNFTIDPILVTRGSYGRIDARVATSLQQWRRINAAVQFTQFPVEPGNASLALQLTGGTNDIALVLPDAKSADPLARKLRVETDLNLRSAVAINQQPEGEVRVRAGMHGRIVNLDRIDGNLLGGASTGSGVIDIDDLNAARVATEWKGIQTDRIVRLYPQLKGFGGTLAGNARIAPALAPRPLQPLAFDLYLHAAAGHWRTVRLGDGQIHAFLNPYTFQFIASDEQLSSMQLGGGSVDFWFSATRHLDTTPTPQGIDKVTGVTISNLLNLKLNDLEVDQFVQAFDPDHAPGLGKLGGQIFTLSAPKTKLITQLAQDPTTQPSATSQPSTTAPATRSNTAATPEQQNVLQHILATTTVDGNLRIEQSDLGKFGPISSLYDFMHLNADVRSSTGHGTIALHMEQGQLRISNLYYFNRGIEVRGVASVNNTWELPDNRISGSAVGTVRPLKDIKLPLFAEADAILSNLQGSLTGVEFAGTVKEPLSQYIKQITLTQLGGELRSLLLSEVGANRSQ